MPYSIGDYVRYWGEVTAEQGKVFSVEEIRDDGNLDLTAPGAEIRNVKPENVIPYVKGE